LLKNDEEITNTNSDTGIINANKLLYVKKAR